MRVKNTWRFSLSHANPHSETAAALWADIGVRTLELLTRAQNEGLIDPAADLQWTRQVYYALLSEALEKADQSQDPDAHDPDKLAALVIDTLLHGAGPHSRTAPSSRGDSGVAPR